MEGRLLLRDCALFPPNGLIQTGLSIVIEGARVSAIGPSRQLPTLPGDWEVACAGRRWGKRLVHALARVRVWLGFFGLDLERRAVMWAATARTGRDRPRRPAAED